MAGQFWASKISRKAAALLASSCLLSPLESLAQVADPSSVQPMYGDIAPYFGDVGPDYGKLRPYYGKLRPFYGKLRPFFGVIDPDYGKLRPYGDGSLWTSANPYVQSAQLAGSPYLVSGTDAFWGSGAGNPFAHNPSKTIAFNTLADFWATTGQNWSTVMATWSKASTAADYNALATLINTTIIAPANSYWSSAVWATATANSRPQVGLVAIAPDNPAPANVKALLTSALGAYGIRLSAGQVDPTSLANVSQSDQASAFLSVYDNLMAYSGAPHVDWWMGQVGWSPYLAQQVSDNTNRRRPLTVGLLDMSANRNGQSLAKGSLYQYGADVFDNGHGAAVASLIVGSFDGSGVMGVLPSKLANVAVYNPYDSTHTTNWTEVGKGVDALSALLFGTVGSDVGIGVLNASLGVKGQTLDAGWNTALASGSAHGHVLVVAAGNDGATQSTNIPWTTAVNPALLVVGSVGLDRTISNFSNMPGEACLIDTATGACDKLKNHFIVAPGELILVSDGHGGTTRQSGTSLAAPLVSGAVALLQARWPWFAWHPNALVDIITKSATPLGTNPGADPVYGVGELNIAASQSPLNWNNLKYFTVDSTHPQIGKGDGTAISIPQLVSKINTGSQAVWNSSKLYITAVETIDDTARDFKIPLSSALVGQHVWDAGGLPAFQSFLSTSLVQWASTNPQLAGLVGHAFSGGYSANVDYGRVAGLSARLSMAPAKPVLGFRADAAPYQSDLSLVGAKYALQVGYGENLSAFGVSNAFASADGFDQGRAVSEPYMRLAAGGPYGALHFSPFSGVVLTASTTEIRRVRDETVYGPAVRVSGAATYQATAQSIGVAYRLSPRTSVRVAVTQLHEANGLLGVQALAPDLLTGGSTTQAMSVEAHTDLSGGFSAHATVSTGRTRTAGNQGLRTFGDGLTSNAAAISVVKTGFLSAGDTLKLTLSEPMHVASGAVTLYTYGVTDRDTGTTGVISESQSLKMSDTPYAVELNYGRSLGHGREAGAFFRFERGSPAPGQTVTATSLFGIKASARF